VAAIILDTPSRLYMDNWHRDDTWRDRTCAEEAACGTTHCLAGWLQVCEGDRNLDPATAGAHVAPVAARLFYSDSETVLEWLRSRKYVEELAE
jgi:hypothetical protein